ncbi:Imm26 family immunity protein [Asticcacaulis sp.]|uniref:Imm26 family immunity protein n=1 Tax=Asticcacaulis sp. TaxID=1872648 RepID=UPI0026319466|nr:Imm26 family immunity protein [Asticcacaulis sp.]
MGDIFALQLPNGKYLHGCVIICDAKTGPMPGANLLYVYKDQSDSLEPDYEALRPHNLLVPPVWTNRLAWERGYFVLAGRMEVTSSRRLRTHLFWSILRKKYVTETGVNSSWLQRLLNTKFRGSWGLKSYLGIDDDISEAIGIPKIPE